MTIGFNFLVHNNGANTIATISLPGDAAGQVPKIVTGGNDSTWKVMETIFPLVSTLYHLNESIFG